jgi:NAD(P)-dependent dehydrogenase (short-subunit alcohol dehydrogenase family)
MPPLCVFITGASSGIGEALARAYAADGATVGLFARREGELARVAESIARRVPASLAEHALAAGGGGAADSARNDSSTIHSYAGDVRDAGALAAAAADFIARHGAPDVVIANAGVSRGTLTEHPRDLAAFRAVFDTNVVGMVNTFAAFAASMQRARAGTLVGIASVAGFRGLAGSGAYSASKSAAITYLESLRLEMRPHGIAVVTICPGYVGTAMTARNPYRMPFKLEASVAAAKITKAIARRRRFYVLPWPMAIVGALLRVLPRPIYDAMFAGAARKPRVDDDAAR